MLDRRSEIVLSVSLALFVVLIVTGKILQILGILG